MSNQPIVHGNSFTACWVDEASAHFDGGSMRPPLQWEPRRAELNDQLQASIDRLRELYRRGGMDYDEGAAPQMTVPRGGYHYNVGDAPQMTTPQIDMLDQSSEDLIEAASRLAQSTPAAPDEIQLSDHDRIYLALGIADSRTWVQIRDALNSIANTLSMRAEPNADTQLPADDEAVTSESPMRYRLRELNPDINIAGDAPAPEETLEQPSTASRRGWVPPVNVNIAESENISQDVREAVQRLRGRRLTASEYELLQYHTAVGFRG